MYALNQQLDQWHLLKHPFYQAWTAGSLTFDHLRTYACQYYHQVSAFPRYVSATHANCESLANRQVLLENLMEEEQGPNNHAALWLKFAASLGISETTVKNTTKFPETKQLIATFLSLCQSSYAKGLGALYAYERQVPDVASSKIAGLKKHYGITAETSIKFFQVHIQSDVAHTQDTAALIQQLDTPDQQQAYNAAITIASAVWDLLTGIYVRTIGSSPRAVVA